MTSLHRLPLPLLGLTTALLGACGEQAPPPPAPLPAGGALPDVILVSIDTLRADHVGAWGYARDTTPFLDRLAAGGVRFSAARSPSPWTLPSHTTMLSGRLPLHHKVVEDGVSIPPELPLLAEAMTAQGYSAVGIATAPFLSPRYGFARGFDEYEAIGVPEDKAAGPESVDAEQAVARALQAVRARPGESVFLFLHLFDVHTPYGAPAPWNEAFDRPNREGDPVYLAYWRHAKDPLDAAELQHVSAEYDEELRYVDAQLERLYGAFVAAGRAPVILVTADHGEELGERGSWGHGWTTHEELLHVPMLLKGPGLPAGVVVEELVGLQDVAPTLTDLQGEPLPGDGESLLPVARGEADSAQALAARSFPFETSRHVNVKVGLIDGGLRLHWDLVDDHLALYDDPAERQDVSLTRPEDLARMRAALVEAVGQPWTAQPGLLRSEGGVFLVDGVRVPSPLTLEADGRFALLPADAPLQHDELGPWQAAGGTQPGDGDPVQLESALSGAGLVLSPEERAMLEALGYVQ